MEKLYNIKNTLISLVEQQMANPQCVDTHEMGEVIDMIKDLAEACYYGSIVDAMEKTEREEVYGIGMMDKDYKKRRYYMNDNYFNDNYYYGIGAMDNRKSFNSKHSTDRMSYMDSDLGYNGSDYMGIGAMSEDSKKMGHSPLKRKSYIESKEKHLDQALQMRELEDYAQELTSDLMDMIKDATPEEKQLLQRKVATLATKIV